MIKTCLNCFGWDKIEHDILMYAGLRTKGGD